MPFRFLLQSPSLHGWVAALYCGRIFLGGVPRTSGRAFRYYSATKPGCDGLSGVTAAIPHPKVQHAAAFAERFYKWPSKGIAMLCMGLLQMGIGVFWGRHFL